MRQKLIAGLEMWQGSLSTHHGSPVKGVSQRPLWPPVQKGAQDQRQLEGCCSGPGGRVPCMLLKEFEGHEEETQRQPGPHSIYCGPTQDSW